MIELAFSILAADFAHLADEIGRATAGGGTIVHVDVMDGHFVPNITFGPPVVKAIRPVTTLPLDCHLMIENPDEFIPAFAEAGADMVSVQVEACRHLNRTLQLILDHGMLPGVVLNPATPVEMLSEVLSMVHHVLVMSVNPGFGGQKFLPRSIERIAHLAPPAPRARPQLSHRSRRRHRSRYGGERRRSRSGHARRRVRHLCATRPTRQDRGERTRLPARSPRGKLRISTTKNRPPRMRSWHFAR